MDPQWDAVLADSAFVVRHGSVDAGNVLRYAEELERAMGAVVNRERKASSLPLEPMAALIQYARNSVAALAAEGSANG